MKILSIDLDYFMSPTIQLYNDAFFDNDPLTRWNDLFNNTDFKENHLIIDQSNLLFCFDTFLKSLKSIQKTPSSSASNLSCFAMLG